MRVVRMIVAAAVLAGSTAAADAKGGGANANKAPQAQSSVRAGDSVPDRNSRPRKNHHKNNGSVCSNGVNGKSANCAAGSVSPQ